MSPLPGKAGEGGFGPRQSPEGGTLRSSGHNVPVTMPHDHDTTQRQRSTTTTTTGRAAAIRHDRRDAALKSWQTSSVALRATTPGGTTM